MTPPSGEPLDALLVHAGWARTLARHLVQDADKADDLVQRAWLAALEQPPADAIPPRRWLAAVLRNLAREMRRGDARRSARENDAAKPEQVESGSPLEQIEVQRRLLAAIESLGEPYRTTVWSRYYEGLSPRAIAARDGVPVKTVSTRLHRALQELRARLDRDHGGHRGAWTALFLPLIDVPLVPAALTGAFLVDAKLKIAGALAIAAGVLCAGFVLFDGGAVEPQPTRAAAPEAAVLQEPHEPVVDAPLSADRTAVVGAPTRPTVAAEPAAANASAAPISGRVVDLESRPVPHVQLVVEDMRGQRRTPEVDVESDGNGRFELPPAASGFTVQVVSPAWVTVFAGYAHGGGEVTVYVAPRRELAGTVVDSQGQTVAGAHVEIELDPALRRAEGRRLDGAYALPYATTTDAQGRFELLDAPQCAATIVAAAFEHGTARVEAPAPPTLDLKIVLPALDAKHALVRGVVVDAEHEPIADAWVATGSASQRTNSEGRFEFDLSDPRTEWSATKRADGDWGPMFAPGTLRAVKPGHMPAEVALPSIEELRAREKPAEFELVLGESPRVIEGHVVDADGKPLRGVRLRTLDEQPFGQILEEVGGAQIGHTPSIESLLRGEMQYDGVRTDAEGSFRIEGLLDHDYRLVAVDAGTMRRVTTAPVHAGARDVRIALPAVKDLPHVAGRVVSRAGTPLVGITILATRVWEDGQPELYFGSRRTTDEEGRFDLGRLDPDGLKLQVNSPTIFIEIGWSPPENARFEELEIAVSTRCLVQVDLGDRPGLADEFSVVDDRGEPVILLHFAGPSMWLPPREPIVEGRSEVIAAEEKGRTVVLWKMGEEVARLPVRLDGQNLTIVRP